MYVARTALIASSDPQITRSLEICLRQEGFCSLVLEQGNRVYEVQRAALPDLIVLDADLLDVDSWQLCQLIRHNNPVPIVMAGSLPRDDDHIDNTAADDFIAKPIDCQEVVTRIDTIFKRVVFARANGHVSKMPPEKLTHHLKIGDVVLDTAGYKVHTGNQVVSLRQKEFDLLHTLMSSPGEVISRAELLDRVWGVDWLGDTRTLDVHIRWVREKIEAQPSQPKYIQTVRGVGYRFAAVEEITRIDVK
jgi:DNA-binding response OmpR family regulator